MWKQVDPWHHCGVGSCDPRLQPLNGFALTPDDTAQVELEVCYRAWCSLYALKCALNMYSGSGGRRILIQGAVSDAVQSTCGLPPGCGLAVDLLHAFLIRTLQSAGRQVEVHKYVDDMVLVAAGPYFAHYLRDLPGCAQSSKTGQHAGQPQEDEGLACRFLAPCGITTRDLGVDTQWASWRKPVQRKNLRTFEQSMTRVRALGLPAHVKALLAANSLHSVGLYGADA
eukprot:6154667-Amphidinium_carterae.2